MKGDIEKMLKWRMNILSELKNAGYSQSAMLRDKTFGAATLNQLRVQSTNISLATVDKLCSLLNCQPSDLLEWIEIDGE